jgi:uncharacterized membrane protein
MNGANPRNSSAGGVLVALGAIAGAVVGLIEHQPTLYFLIGLGAGIIAAIAIWLVDRRR